MHSLQILSLAIGLALALVCQALPQVPHIRTQLSVAAANAIPTKDFLLSQFNETSVVDASTQSWKRYLSFVFADPNSNTSTTCGANWIDTNNSSRAPAEYVQCKLTAGTAKPEFFIWYITSYTSPLKFSLQLAHEFSDPMYFAPPYDYVEFFAPVNVTLHCQDEAGTYCKLPTRKSPLHAVINNISN